MWQTLLPKLLPVAGNLLGGLFGNKSVKNAGQAQQQGYQQGIDTIGGYYNDAKGYMNPYMQTGTQANSGIQGLMNGDLSGYYNSPDFQGRLKAGGQMFDSSAAARGGVFGGGATRGREMYAQEIAQQGLGDYRNWLGQVAGQGQNAAGTLSGMGADAGNSIARLYGAQGEARASSYGQQGANTFNALTGAAGALGSMWGGRTGGNAQITRVPTPTQPRIPFSYQPPSMYGPPKLNG